MRNIIGTGFNVGSDDGEFLTLEADLRALAEIGCDTVEIGVTSLDLIAGGRIIAEGTPEEVAGNEPIAAADGVDTARGTRKPAHSRRQC